MTDKMPEPQVHNIEKAGDTTATLTANAKKLTNSDSSRNCRALKRQTLFFALLSSLALFIFIVISLYNHISAARYQQIESEISQLINPLSLSLGELIEKDDLSKLQQFIDISSNHPFVISANVFTINSELLVSSTLDYKSNVQMRRTYINKPNVRFYLQPIWIVNKQVGFLQLQIAYEKMYRDNGIFKLDLTMVIVALFILSLALGIATVVMFKRLLYTLTQG